ncbi:MAG: YigZ family protein [Thermomicrobiales bacterium]
MTELRRVAGPGSHEIEIRKSRFICSVARAETDDEARAMISDLRKRYWQANHNCFAYILGERGDIQRSSDDGEPSGTAGIPMLDVLRKMYLTDTVAVVTRYFGGTLLGAGGLIRAYSGAVGETIRLVGVVERRILSIVALDVNHADAGRIHNALASSGFPEATVSYGAEAARFLLHLQDIDQKPFTTWVAEISNGSLHIEILGETGIDIPCDIDTTKE